MPEGAKYMEKLGTEGRFQADKWRIYDDLSVSIWEVDLQLVRDSVIDFIYQNNINDLEFGLADHFEILSQFMHHMHILYVNDCTLKMYHAGSREELQKNIPALFRSDSWPYLLSLTRSLVNGESTFIGEGVNYSLDGERLQVVVSAGFGEGELKYRQVTLTVVNLNGQQRSAERIRMSEERLQTVLKAIPDCIYLIDREGFYLDYYHNTPGDNASGKTPIIGLHVKDLFSPETAAEFIHKIALCLDNPDTQYLYYTKEEGGISRFFESRIVSAGKYEVLVLESDVTLKKLAETELTKSFEHYRALFESANDAILIIDPQSEIILSANSQAESLYGFKLDEFIGLSLKGLAKDGDLNFGRFTRDLGKAGFRNLETLHYSKTGQEIHLLVNGSRIDFQGRECLLLINHDISELKKAEKVKNATYRISELAMTVERNEELFAEIHKLISGLMPASNLYIALYDPDNDLLSFPYYIDEKDAPPEPARPGKGITEYVLRTGQPLLVNSQIINELTQKGEIDIIGTLTYDWLGVPLKTKERAIGVLAVQSYHEGIGFSESDKEILNYVSEQIAMAIDSRMKEAELRKAKNSAEASSRIKSALLKNMSHEFRTPMNGILNFAGVLSDQLVAEDQQAMASAILSSGNRLMASLDAIMYLAQIESSSMSLEISRLEIGEQIRIILEDYAQEAMNKGLNFKVYYESKAWAYVDKVLLIQICKYLLDNAIKFTPTGLISIYIRKNEYERKEYAEIEISDTGIGISEQNQRLIFSEFWQESMGYGRSHEGFGLGLTLSKKMVELMNGRILLTSQTGKGSAFTVRFPYAAMPKPEASGEQNPKPGVETGSASGEELQRKAFHNKPEVLVVEDNQVNMELTTMFLKDICTTDRAKDGLTAIKLAGAKKYDAILMDINLGPGMNGLEAATEIRKIDGYAHTPIVAVTGYTMSGDREKMLQGGCSHYLPKPFDKKGIVKMVRDVLNLPG